MDRKSELLQLARDIYLAGGQEQLTMRNLAQRAGISAPAIYRHFKNKEQLFTALLEEGVRHMSKAVPPLPPPAELQDEEVLFNELKILPATLLSFSREHPKYYDALFFIRRDLPDDIHGPPPFVRRHLDPLRLRITRALESGMEQQIFTVLDPLETTLALIGLCHGIISLQRLGLPLLNRFSFEELYWNSVDRFIRGLRSVNI